jgi:hypothetical protein
MFLPHCVHVRLSDHSATGLIIISGIETIGKLTSVPGFLHSASYWYCSLPATRIFGNFDPGISSSIKLESAQCFLGLNVMQMSPSAGGTGKGSTFGLNLSTNSRPKYSP